MRGLIIPFGRFKKGFASETCHNMPKFSLDKFRQETHNMVVNLNQKEQLYYESDRNRSSY